MRVRHECRGKNRRINWSHLLVEAQLVIQDDAVGLLRLRPRQGEAVHGGADLVHDGNYGGSCRTQGERQSQFLWQCLDVLYLCVSVWNIDSDFFSFFQLGRFLLLLENYLKGRN